TPKVVEALEELGAEIATWLVEDMPPLLQEGLTALGEKLAEWGRALPARIVEALSDAQQIQEAITKWGPRIVAGLAIAAGIAVLAVPTIIGAIGAAMIVVFMGFVSELGTRLGTKFREMMGQAGIQIQVGVNNIALWF